MTKNQLDNIINNTLQPIGYTKKGNAWYKHNLETTTIFALDKSRWGSIYYAYLCVNFNQLPSEHWPKFNKCHSRFRVEHLGEKTESYLNLDNDIDLQLRIKKINKLLEKSIHYLNQASSVKSFQHLLDRYPEQYFWLTKDAQDLIKE